MSRHPSALDLARLSEGDLSPRKAARIRAHLDDCAACQQVYAELEGVSVLLASVQEPPIPAHLAARIETALATESAHRVASEPASESGRRDLPSRSRAGRGRAGRGRAGRPASGRPSPLALRILAGAGVVVVLAGIGFGLSRHAGPTSSSTSGTASRVPAAKVSGERAAAPVYGPALSYQHDGRTESFTPVATRTNFVPGQLSAQVKAAMRVSRLSTPSPAGSAALGASPNAAPSPAPAGRTMLDQFGRQIALARLGSCVGRITPAGQVLLLVDPAQYLGRAATIIVTAVSSGSGSSQVWVVGPSCSASDSDILAHETLPQQ
ncbi:MAG: anti-sigma factor family protein [Streptosporangiaceae bacterium]